MAAHPDDRTPDGRVSASAAAGTAQGWSDAGRQPGNAWGDDRPGDGYDDDVFETSTGLKIAAWAAALATFGYLLPWALAVHRNLPRYRSLGVLNLALGWTGIGWILALIEVLLWRPTVYWQQVDQARQRLG